MSHWKNEAPLVGVYIMPDLVEVCGTVWKCMKNKLKDTLSLPYIQDTHTHTHTCTKPILLSGLYIVPYTNLQRLWAKNMIFQISSKTTV
jgi:hypothetical protein